MAYLRALFYNKKRFKTLYVPQDMKLQHQQQMKLSPKKRENPRLTRRKRFYNVQCSWKMSTTQQQLKRWNIISRSVDKSPVWQSVKTRWLTDQMAIATSSLQSKSRLSGLRSSMKVYSRDAKSQSSPSVRICRSKVRCRARWKPSSEQKSSRCTWWISSLLKHAWLTQWCLAIRLQPSEEWSKEVDSELEVVEEVPSVEVGALAEEAEELQDYPENEFRHERQV